MGKLCSKGAQSIDSSFIPQEDEVNIPSYKNVDDKYYEALEKKYNYLSKILFQDYLYSLVNFSRDNATLEDDFSNSSLDHSSNDSFYSEKISIDLFLSFIENKILKHKLLYEESSNNENITSLFKEIITETYSGLAKKMSQDKGPQTDEKEIITKGFLIPLGILHCAGPNYAKIRTIFNLFQEGDKLKSSETFSKFLLSLFLSGAYCPTYARYRLQNHEEIGNIDKNDVKKLYDTCELKDSQHLVEVVNKLMFGDDLSQSLDYNSFKAKFGDTNKDSSLGFMLTPPGIRFMQIKHNV